MIELERVIVVSLAFDRGRRRHIERHFRDIGISSFRFADAISQSDPAVRAAYESGRVVRYPVCFRCGKGKCPCKNNIIIPPQVANWLSFQAIWETLPSDPDRYFLLCEDDVAFHTNALNSLYEFLARFVPNREQVLIRLSASGQEPFRDLSGHRLRVYDEPVMSNSAYILNGALANRLAREAHWITHTSDVWLHSDMAKQSDIQAITIDPLLATDLSFNKEFAQFASRIHPKGIDPDDVKRKERHIMRANSAAEYDAHLAEWLSG